MFGEVRHWLECDLAMEARGEEGWMGVVARIRSSGLWDQPTKINRGGGQCGVEEERQAGRPAGSIGD